MTAQLEVSFHYKQTSQARAIILSWIWVGVGLVVAPFVGHQTFQLMAFLHPPLFIKVLAQFVISVGSAIVYAYVPFRLAMSCVQGNSILINEHGMGLPCGLLGNSKWFNWSQLALAAVTDKQLKLNFKDKVVHLNTNQIEDGNLEKILMAIEVWGHKTSIENSLIDMRDQLQNKRAGIETHSYTQLWEDELNRRFNSTTFVPLEPGHKLRSDSLTIKKQLAFGGFSSVYVAQDKSGTSVVVKESVVSTESGAQKKAIEFFKREALYLSKLKHPQIAQVLDSFVENSRNYLVLEYIQGETLREHVRRTGPMREFEVIRITQQMARVLDFMHSQEPPIIHRDFTPDNLVFKTDGTVVVIDFGAANEFVGTATGTLIGKQCYMPPEQVRGKSEPATDYYALGCTAYFLLTGKDPVALVTSHPRQQSPELSEKLDELIADLTASDVKARLQSAHELNIRIKAWAKHIGGES